MVSIGEVRNYLNCQETTYPPPNVSPEGIGKGDGSLAAFYLRFPNVDPASVYVWAGTLVIAGTTQSIVWYALPGKAFVLDNQLIALNSVALTAEGAVGSAGEQTVQLSDVSALYVGEQLDYDTGAAGESIQLLAVDTGAETITAVFTKTHLTGVDVSGTGAPAPGVLMSSRYQASPISDAYLQNIIDRNTARYGDEQTVLKGCMNDWIDILLTNPELFKLTRYADYQNDATRLVQQFSAAKQQLQAELEGAPRAGKAIPFNATRLGPPKFNRWTMQR